MNNISVRILKRLKPNPKNNFKLYAFDVETKQFKKHDYTEQKFLMGSVVDENLNAKVFWNKNEMANYLLSRELANSSIFATNLDFDFHMIFNDTKYENEFKRIYHPSSLIYACRLHQKRRWKFYDTLNYINLSVEKLGKMLKAQLKIFRIYLQ